MRSAGRGVALGTVLLCLVALTLVLFTAASAAISHLRFAESVTAGNHARNLAESALAQTMSRLIQSDYTFGRSVGDRVTVTLEGVAGAEGEVSFDPGEFATGFSTNNLDKDAARTGAGGRQVPGRTIHVVARGRCGSAERWVECLYYRPPFPDGLACTGKVDARSVYLTGVRRAADYVGGDPAQIAYKETVPANIFSNSASRGPLPAASVSGQSTVTGSVGAVGSVSVTPECSIEGEILAGSEPRAIPDLRLDEKFSIVEENNVPLPSSSSGDLRLEPNFFALASGGLQVDGDLDMNGSVLLVKGGDLRVSGGIKGTGIILSEGDVIIRDGRSQLSTKEQVAIGCKGDFKLQAESPEGNYFQGLVYAEGDIEAKDITVVGAIVANGKNGAAGDVKLDNVRFIYNPGSMEIVAVPPFTAGCSIDGKWYHSSYSALIRPGDEPREWVVDVWTGIQLAPLPRRSEKLTVAQLRDGSPLTWRETHLQTSTFTPQEERFRTTGGLFEFYGPWEMGSDLAFAHYWAHDQGLSVAARWLDGQKSLGGDGATWYSRMSLASDANPHGPDRPDGEVMAAEVFDTYRRATDSQTPSGVLHFNLNNLLAELGPNTARILLWRPIERP